MSSSNVSNVSATVIAINEATMVYSRCWLFMMVALGMIGHSLSIYVFSRRTLRKNPCAKYFLASTVVGCCIVYGNLPLRTLQMGYQIDVFVYSLPVCKLLSFLTACTRVLPAWFIALACADRFLQSSSSATLRGWSSLRVTRLAIPFTTLLIGLMHIHILVYNTIVQSPLSCVGQSSTYQTFYSFFNLIIWALVPSLGMLIFGLLTIHQYRQGKKRVAPTNTQNVRQKISRSTDRQLIQMMLVQSLVFGLTTSAASFSFLGSLSDVNSITDPIGAARKNLIKDVTFSIELKDRELVQEYFVFDSNRIPMKWIHTSNWSGGYLNEEHMPFVPLPPSFTPDRSNSIRKNQVQFQGHSEIHRLLSENGKNKIEGFGYGLKNGILAISFDEDKETFYPGDGELWEDNIVPRDVTDIFVNEAPLAMDGVLVLYI
ncbi:unnamed protein product [Adineta steineri]|uniref:G-protein coupled receptors family 1 profile domain-containing protein n=1 Tax=Adineta steineri TaxID=433720 RepID=A0A819KAT8_9BILA|nr:unnamed protein product [Adineta steineri]CAF3944864.1 unnamed protein product [Adineta steineri]